MGETLLHRILVGVVCLAAWVVCVAASSGADEKPATRPAVGTRPASTKPATTQPSNLVVIDTSMGRITVELTPEKTPITVKNFLQYVKDGHYDDTVFHRVIQGFMIQGGGYAAFTQEEKKTRSPIKNESQMGLSNVRGTISMARMTPPDSATAQFFINTVDNKRLDTYGGGYTVFGKVVKGMDVVDKIASTPVAPGPLSPAQPIEPVRIKSIRPAPAD